MLPAVPLPAVLSQMTRLEVEHLGVAEALPVAASEAAAAIVAAEARTAAPVSAMARVSGVEGNRGDRVLMLESAFVLRRGLLTVRLVGGRGAARRPSSPN